MILDLVVVSYIQTLKAKVTEEKGNKLDFVKKFLNLCCKGHHQESEKIAGRIRGNSCKPYSC